jgi:hypothetical protein
VIISVHVPKTAGISFQALLKREFGSRILFDYGDWVGLETPTMQVYRQQRAIEMRARKDELLRDYDVIYGHFAADKYRDLFPDTKFSAFFRDPYQQIVSLYKFLERSRPDDKVNYLHAGVKLFHDIRPTLLEFIEIVSSIQSDFIGDVPIDDLAVVGLVEQYERSVVLFSKVFGRALPADAEKFNVNPTRDVDGYERDAAVRAAIERHCARDIELYRRARERFEALTKLHDM